jgi:hypothetical protein
VPEVFVTSPVVVYAVVAAFIVAEAKYRAALKVSVVGEVKLERETIVEVPNWCWPSISSLMNDVHIDWVFAMMGPYEKEADSPPAKAGIFLRVTCAERWTSSPSNQYSTQVVNSFSLSTVPSRFSSKVSSISPFVVVTIAI